MSRVDESVSRRGPLLRYAAAWLLGGAVVTLVVVLALRAGEGDSGRRPGEVALPPVEQTGLEGAVEAAGCRVLGAREARRADVRVSGRSLARPVAAGVYERPAPESGLLAAIRRGTVVLRFRRDAPTVALASLRELQSAVPRATVVAPAPPRLRYDVAAAAWRRLLVCPRLSRQSVDAIRLFRGRFIGTGPDRP